MVYLTIAFSLVFWTTYLKSFYIISNALWLLSKDFNFLTIASSIVSDCKHGKFLSQATTMTNVITCVNMTVYA